jgi:hypothetical protein
VQRHALPYRSAANRQPKPICVCKERRGEYAELARSRYFKARRAALLSALDSCAEDTIHILGRGRLDRADSPLLRA